MPFVPTGRGLLARPGPACGVEPIPPPFFAPALKRSARRVLRVGFVPPGMLLAPLMSMRGGHCARPWLNVVRAGLFRARFPLPPTRNYVGTCGFILGTIYRVRKGITEKRMPLAKIKTTSLWV